ncbi:MAG: transposase, partial [Duodenibacillus sp.]
MTGRPQRFEIRLTHPQKIRLQELADAAQTPARLRNRAQVLLLRSQGRTYSDIASEVDISVPTIAKILKKFAAYGIDEALGDLSRTGRSEAIDAGAKSWLISLACRFPEDVPEGPDQERWTVTALTDYVRTHGPAAGYTSLQNIHSSTVWNILNDPAFTPRHQNFCLECRDESPSRGNNQVLLLYKRMELVPKFVRDDLGAGFCAVAPESAAYAAVMEAVTQQDPPDPTPPGPRQPDDEHFSVLIGTD